MLPNIARTASGLRSSGLISRKFRAVQFEVSPDLKPIQSPAIQPALRGRAVAEKARTRARNEGKNAAAFSFIRCGRLRRNAEIAHERTRTSTGCPIRS